PVVGDITPVVRPAVGDEPSGISANSPSIASEILLIAPGVMLPTTRATGTALIPGKDARAVAMPHNTTRCTSWSIPSRIRFFGCVLATTTSCAPCTSPTTAATTSTQQGP